VSLGKYGYPDNICIITDSGPPSKVIFFAGSSRFEAEIRFFRILYLGRAPL
jgi:hypothetical protein